MEVTFSEKAIEKLRDKLVGKDQSYLFLDYEVDGCGCVMSGVTLLTTRNEKAEGDFLLHTNFLPVLIEKKYKVFFDEQMKIDFQAKYNCFQLKSDNQILNPRMGFVVKEEI